MEGLPSIYKALYKWKGYPPFIKGLGPMPFISPPLLIMDLRGVVWAGAHSALTPFPFGVTLKGLGVNPRVRAEWAPAPDSGLSGPLPYGALAPALRRRRTEKLWGPALTPLGLP